MNDKLRIKNRQFSDFVPSKTQIGSKIVPKSTFSAFVVYSRLYGPVADYEEISRLRLG
jgi:hypothetical protein